jgi:hypothetical protein
MHELFILDMMESPLWSRQFLPDTATTQISISLFLTVVYLKHEMGSWLWMYWP